MKKLILILAAVSLAFPFSALASGNGEAVYNKACGVCHNSGIAGAPKLGDQAAWKPLIAKGEDALTETAVKGKGAMPPKGGQSGLSEEEVEAAVKYMMEKGK